MFNEANDILEHEWFSTIDFGDLYNKKVGIEKQVKYFKHINLDTTPMGARRYHDR